MQCAQEALHLHFGSCFCLCLSDGDLDCQLATSHSYGHSYIALPLSLLDRLCKQGTATLGTHHLPPLTTQASTGETGTQLQRKVVQLEHLGGHISRSRWHFVRCCSLPIHAGLHTSYLIVILNPTHTELETAAQ